MARLGDFGAKMDAELASNPRLNELFQRELTRLKLAEQIASARKVQKLSQLALAERIGTKQPTVARMERADYTNYNVRTLAKVAAATGHRLDVRLVPLGRVGRTGKFAIARRASAHSRRGVKA